MIKNPCTKTTNASEEINCTASDTCWIEQPQFFNGQLLTDADLKAGMRYVIEKNKLHNRYLHGWGVVCGLKVKCYPCCSGHGSSGKVVVEPGYAIDCCGRDIVVPGEADFDVAAAVQELTRKKKAAAGDCGPAPVQPSSACADKTEKYYLVLKYKEEVARPASALKSNDECTVARCLPSRIRECYELSLVDYCTLTERYDDNMLSKIAACIKLLMDTGKKTFGDNFVLQDLFTFKSDLVKEFVKDYYKAMNAHVRCELLDELEALKDEESTDPDRVASGLAMDNTAATYNRFQMYYLLIEALMDCICQAVLKPCPECGRDDVVILATITLKGQKIDNICNFSRRWVMSFPTLFYWLPIDGPIGKLVQQFCCFDFLKKPGSYPLWIYVAKFLENDLAAPKAMSKTFQDTLGSIPKSLFTALDPANVSLEKALRLDATESKKVVEEMKMKVVRTEAFTPSLSLEGLFSAIPAAPPKSSLVQLVDKDNKVVGYRVVKDDAPTEKEEIAGLKKELADLKSVLPVMKKDLGSVIKARVSPVKEREELTVKLTEGLLKAMKVEDLEGIDRTKAGKLRKAEIASPLDVLESAPLRMSESADISLKNAHECINEAETAAVDLAKALDEELAEKKITKKEDLAKLDLKKLAKRLNLSEAKVKDAVEGI